MKNVKYLNESQFRHLIRARVLTELRKLDPNQPMKMIDYAYSPDKKCMEFDSPQEAFDFIQDNLTFGDTLGISHALFFGEGNVYAWRREVEDFIENTGVDPRAFVPFDKKGFVEIVDDKMVLTFLKWIQQKYGNLSLYTPNGPADLKRFKY